MINIKNLLARSKYFWGAVFWTLFVTVSCLMAAEKVNRISFFNIPHKDKYVHFAFYFVMVVLWVLSLSPAYASKRRLRLVVFSFAVFYGILIEICQGLLTNGRSADILDVLANTAGATLAILLLWLYRKIKK